MFKQIKKYNLNHFTIYGTYKDNEIRFFQMGNYNAKFSVAMITMDKYAPEFDHILILPKTVLTFGKGYNLEWVDFNKKYLSKLDNPKEALNVLSPTFMETLVDLKNKYGKIEIEYFEDKDYQSNSLIVVKEGHIFDVFKYREDRAPNDIKVLNDFLDDVVKLKSSI